MTQRELALDILYKTIKNESYSNLLMRQELSKVPLIQRGFITNLVNGVLRKYEILEYQIIDEVNNSTSFKLKLILMMALYERFFLNEKDYVVNNEYVKLCKNKFDKGFINAILHKTNTLKQTDKDYINACLPEWLYNLLSKQYGNEELNNILNIYQSIPNVYYRLNKNKCSFSDLEKLNINIINDDIFTSNSNLINTSLYENGYFYIQDYNSSTLYKHLDLHADNLLLDVCSAPGSKLFNCLDIISPNNAYANDIHAHRVELIKKMADKLGYKGINYLNSDGLELKNKLNIKFDRIMLDAPCSGIGVISRKPDLKFHITPNNLDELQKLQLSLLNNNSQLLKVNGILLYSTCTLNKKENSKLVDKFLKDNDDFIKIEEDTIINDMGDCFYLASIKRIK